MKNKGKMKMAAIKNGVYNIDGKEISLISADYPYYRDNPSRWEGQLERLKKMGVKTVTFYIPWRFHSVSARKDCDALFDFTGKTSSQRDVVAFIELCKAKDLSVVVKPGPLIHAETLFAGLPDDVGADLNPAIMPILNSKGEPYNWNHHLPAPLGDVYLKKVRHWLGSVAKEVILPYQYPKGPIVGVQLLNEGIYTNGQLPINAYDYSESGLREYRLFIQKKYKSLEKYNRINHTTIQSWDTIPAPREWAGMDKKEKIFPFLDWAEFTTFFYGKVIKTYKSFFGKIKVPVLLNLNCPMREAQDHEAYMARNNSSAWEGTAHYGFTDWAGNPMTDERAYRIYRMMAQKDRGICLEENWGLTDYYQKDYKSAETSFFQSMLYVANGATGMNIYTGVSTEGWEESLAQKQQGSYGPDVPIAVDGSYRKQYWSALLMHSFLESEGSRLVASERLADFTWGLYLPYCRAAAWQMNGDEWKKAGFSSAPRSATCWDSFLALARDLRVQTGVVNLELVSEAQLNSHRIVFLHSSDWLDRETQKKLLNYISKGGILVLTGVLPHLDETLQSFSQMTAVLFDSKREVRHTMGASCKLFQHGKGKCIFIEGDFWKWEGSYEKEREIFNSLLKLFPPKEKMVVTPNDSALDTVLYKHGSKNLNYLFLLNRKSTRDSYKIECGNGLPDIEVKLPSFSASVIGIENKKITCALLNCVDDLNGQSVPPFVSVGNERIVSEKPCNLWVGRKGKKISIVAANLGESKTKISLPWSDVKHFHLLRDGGRSEPVRWTEEPGALSFEAESVENSFCRYEIVLK